MEETIILSYLRKRRLLKKKKQEIKTQAMPDGLACTLGITYKICGYEGIKRWHKAQRHESRIMRHARKILGDKRFKETLSGSA